jgi:hypothetical protein
MIKRDPLPPLAYDANRATRFHLTFINAAQFRQATGLPSPPPPISTETYHKFKLLWYALYNECTPPANDSDPASSALADLWSVGEIDRDRPPAAGDARAENDCERCSHELATILPAHRGHPFRIRDDDCAHTPQQCPSCGYRVPNRAPLAAPMPVPGQEEENIDGVDALSLDERIVRLRAFAEAGKVCSFRSKAHAVAPLSGFPHPELEA